MFLHCESGRNKPTRSGMASLGIHVQSFYDDVTLHLSKKIQMENCFTSAIQPRLHY